MVINKCIGLFLTLNERIPTQAQQLIGRLLKWIQDKRVA